MLVYKLTFYDYCTYSYSGKCEADSHYFASLQGAKAFANKLGFEVKEYCSDPNKECTIETIFVKPD